MPPATASFSAPQSRSTASAQPAGDAPLLDHDLAAAKASAAVHSKAPNQADCPKQQSGLHGPKPAVQPAADPRHLLPSGSTSQPVLGCLAADTASDGEHGDAAPDQTHPSKQNRASPAMDAAEQASDQAGAVLPQLSRQPGNTLRPAAAAAKSPVPTHSPDRPDSAALRQAPANQPAAEPQQHVAHPGQPVIQAKHTPKPASAAAGRPAFLIAGMQARISVRPPSAAAQTSVPTHSPGKQAGGQTKPLFVASELSAEPPQPSATPPQHTTAPPAPQLPGSQSTAAPRPASASAGLPVPVHGPAQPSSMPMRPGPAAPKLSTGPAEQLDALRHPMQPGKHTRTTAWPAAPVAQPSLPPINLSNKPSIITQPASADAVLSTNPCLHENTPLAIKHPTMRSSTITRPASAAVQPAAQPHKRKHVTFSAQGFQKGSQQHQDPQRKAKSARAASEGEQPLGVLNQSTAHTGSWQLQVGQPRAFSARAALEVGRNMWPFCSRHSPPDTCCSDDNGCQGIARAVQA